MLMWSSRGVAKIENCRDEFQAALLIPVQKLAKCCCADFRAAMLQAALEQLN